MNRFRKTNLTSAKMGHWSRVMFFVAIGKAAITGAGLAMASLGILDLAMGAPVLDAWQSLQVSEWVNGFAIGGGIAGALFKIISAPSLL